MLTFDSYSCSHRLFKVNNMLLFLLSGNSLSRGCETGLLGSRWSGEGCEIRQWITGSGALPFPTSYYCPDLGGHFSRPGPGRTCHITLELSSVMLSPPSFWAVWQQWPHLTRFCSPVPSPLWSFTMLCKWLTGLGFHILTASLSTACLPSHTVFPAVI